MKLDPISSSHTLIDLVTRVQQIIEVGLDTNSLAAGTGISLSFDTETGVLTITNTASVDSLADAIAMAVALG